ncbi:MAG: SH3 domain-containing protein [Bacillota bacterium]|nr:SH3 domain-containing protein [Bacillota bacterium]
MSTKHMDTLNRTIGHILIIILFATAFTSVYLTSVPEAMGYSKVCRVKASSLNVRKNAGDSYKKVGKLKKGTHKVIISSKKDKKGTTWYKVKYSGSKTGYVSSKYVNIISLPYTSITKRTGTVKCSSGRVTFRSGPGTLYSTRGNIAKGKKITITGKAKDINGKHWYRFSHQGKESYIHSDYIKLASLGNSSSSSSSSSSASSSSSSTGGSSSSSSGNGNASYNYTVGIITTLSSSLNVRSGPGTSYSKLGTIAKGTAITITGSTKATDGIKWYKYKYSATKTGYISSQYVTLKNVKSDENFEKYMNNQGFPESYKGGLRILHATHPNWKFKANNVGCTWSKALNAETKRLSTNVVSKSVPVSYRSKESGSYNAKKKTWTKFDGSWYAASKTVVAYYMDPRNFLNERGIYQFMTHQYDASSQNEATVKAVIKGTFMESRKTGNSTYKNFASLINAAGKNARVNPNVIAAMIIQEQGSKGKSGLISGKSGYYNFFNIGAFTTSKMSAVKRGLWYAKQSGSYGRPWNSIYKSIKGGALFYGANYVKKNQDTYYYKKFNVKNGVSKIGSNQYMTHVSAAASEGNLLRNAFSANSNYSALIEIPVYNSMPQKACPLPD